MPKITFFLIAIAFVSAISDLKSQTRPLKTISAQDFLKLPEEMQLFYMSGALDGISYVSYSYEIPGFDKWVACVRSKPLGETLDRLVGFLKANPREQKYPIPWAIAATIGQSDCAPKK
jgi:hypothetical protein